MEEKVTFDTTYLLIQSLLYPPQTVFVGGGVYCFHVVRPSIRPSVTFCFLNILRVMDGISSNLGYLFKYAGPILTIKMYGLGAISMRVISLCNS